MKRIDKQEAPVSFVQCIKKKRPPNWDSFTKNHPLVKQELVDQLLRDQGYLCCYCEQRIGSDGSHIEHLRPKGVPRFAKFIFEYDNLLSSCLDKDSCGTKKGNWFSDDMVTPLDNHCEERFRYLGNGTITAADPTDSHAEATIDKLNLNSEKLKNMRMQIILVYQYMKENSPDEEFAEYIRQTLRPNVNGEYAEFWTTIKYVAEKA